MTENDENDLRTNHTVFQKEVMVCAGGIHGHRFYGPFGKSALTAEKWARENLKADVPWEIAVINRIPEGQ